MTRYLSTPLEDVRNSKNVRAFKREIDRWKREVGDVLGIPYPTEIQEHSPCTDDELREIGDYFEEVFGWRPTEVIGVDGSWKAVP